MWTYIWIFCAGALMLPAMAHGQDADIKPNPDAHQTHQSSARAELKQSVSKMTYEAGDKRFIHLKAAAPISQAVSQNRLQSRKAMDNSFAQSPAQHSKTAPAPTQNDPVQITVECSPIGEAEAIGIIPMRERAPRAPGNPIEVFAPEGYAMSDAQWRRIATLACTEDEI